MFLVFLGVVLSDFILFGGGCVGSLGGIFLLGSGFLPVFIAFSGGLISPGRAFLGRGVC
ncbi:hypothetical protein EDB80DRAFT_738521 [Ilyonectria destructans]|nr:hypothetical protein EDB80DRAFT_738521 [Ilyonectria destructans]